jgi:hypothetical protein
MSSFQETKSFLASRPLSTLTAASRAPFTVAKWQKVSDAIEVRYPPPPPPSVALPIDFPAAAAPDPAGWGAACTPSARARSSST